MGLFGPTNSGGTGAVQSVNGLTGVVTLDATSVGAASAPLVVRNLNIPSPLNEFGPTEVTLLEGNLYNAIYVIQAYRLTPSTQTLDIRLQSPLASARKTDVYTEILYSATDPTIRSRIRIYNSDYSQPPIYQNNDQVSGEIRVRFYLDITGWKLVPFPQTYESTSNKNQPNGYPGLTAGGLVNQSQLPIATISAAGMISASDISKLNSIESGAQVNVKPNWNAAAGNAAEILNKPTIPAAPVNADWNSTSGLSQILNKPTIPAAPVNADWNSTSGLSQILNKPNLPSKVAFGPMIILRFANWLRGSTGYGPGNPPTGMTTLTPKSGNVVENFNPDIYNPRLFNAGEFFGVGRQYKLICAVRCTEISFDGVHCQLRWFNGTTSQIIPGLMDFGGGNDGIAEKSYWATSDTLTAANEWWTFVPFFGAYNNNNGARIQDCVVVAHLV